MHSTLKTFIDVQGPKFSLTDISEDVKESSFHPNYEEIPSIPGQMLAWYQDRKWTGYIDGYIIYFTNSQKLHPGVSEFSKGSFTASIKYTLWWLQKSMIHIYIKLNRIQILNVTSYHFIAFFFYMPHVL